MGVRVRHATESELILIAGINWLLWIKSASKKSVNFFE